MAISPATLPSARFKRMLERMLDEWIAERGTKHGFLVAMARRLGETGPSIGYYLDGDRNAGLSIVHAAIVEFGIAPDYFHGEKLGRDPDHRDFMALGTRVDRTDRPQRFVDFAWELVKAGELLPAFVDGFVGSLGFLDGPDVNIGRLYQSFRDYLVAHPDAAGPNAPKTEPAKGSVDDRSKRAPGRAAAPLGKKARR